MPSPINLITDREEYVYVELGPLPAARTSVSPLLTIGRYPFPSPEAATRFAKAHKERDPYRKIHIDYPDGRRVEVCSS
ncbi:MAG: hypothetical protein ACXWOV_02785 [Isosphaeraceae bacterium]